MGIQHVPGIALFATGIASLALAAFAPVAPVVAIAMVFLAGALIYAGVFGHRFDGDTAIGAQGFRTTLTSPAAQAVAREEGVEPDQLARIAERVDAIEAQARKQQRRKALSQQILEARGSVAPTTHLGAARRRRMQDVLSDAEREAG